MITTRDIQRRLIALGYDVGPTGADGVPGRNTTKAIARFQEDKKLPIIYPGSVGPKTLAALGLDEKEPYSPPWVTEARRFIGLHEKRDAKVLDMRSQRKCRGRLSTLSSLWHPSLVARWLSMDGGLQRNLSATNQCGAV